MRLGVEVSDVIEKSKWMLNLSESASRLLVSFGVMNDNFIKCLIYFVKYMSIFYMKEVQMCSLDISLKV
jgi:hypothetical protein